MKLIALLSFYDEDPYWLGSATTSAATLGCDHIVALDGAFELYPGGTYASSPEQRRAIFDMAYATGMGCTVHAPHELWPDEVVKRGYHFKLAETIAEEGDWYFAIDADETVTHVEAPVKKALAETELNVADVTLWERHVPNPGEGQTNDLARVQKVEVRRFFRAIPGLRTELNHFTFATPDGRYLCGNHHHHELEPTLDLTAVKIEHLTQFRDRTRRLRQHAYYRLRDAAKSESENGCVYCDDTVVVTLPYGFVQRPEGLLWEMAGVCLDHVGIALDKAEQELEGYPKRGEVLERLRAGLAAEGVLIG